MAVEAEPPVVTSDSDVVALPDPAQAAKDEQEKAESERVTSIVESLGLKIENIKSIGRGNNSIMRLVTVSTLEAFRFTSTQPLTSPIPKDLTSLIVRENNPEGELTPSIAIPNEVIALHFARSAGLSVSKVYEWKVEGDKGWMVIEVLPGIDLSRWINNLELDTPEGQTKLRKALTAEAEMFKRWRQIELPPGIGYGGFKFNQEGEIESGEMSLPYGGPHKTLAGLYGEMFIRQLAAADTCSWMNGWKEDGLRERLDKFVQVGMVQVLSTVGADRPVFVHGDFNMQNVLWDEEKEEISGVFDMEWAHAAGPADEWFYSFGNEEGAYLGPYDEDPSRQLLAASLINGFPTPLPDSGPKPAQQAGPEQWVDWKRAKLWADILQEIDAPRPTIIPGFEASAKVYFAAQEICQWWMLQPRITAKIGEEKVKKIVEENRKHLGMYLESWGY